MLIQSDHNKLHFILNGNAVAAEARLNCIFGPDFGRYYVTCYKSSCMRIFGSLWVRSFQPSREWVKSLHCLGESRQGLGLGRQSLLYKLVSCTTSLLYSAKSGQTQNIIFVQRWLKPRGLKQLSIPRHRTVDHNSDHVKKKAMLDLLRPS